MGGRSGIEPRDIGVEDRLRPRDLQFTCPNGLGPAFRSNSTFDFRLLGQFIALVH